jgi:hypothetical protein
MTYEFFHFSQSDGEPVAIRNPAKEKIIEEFNKIDGKINPGVAIVNFELEYGETLLALGCVEDNNRVVILYQRLGKDHKRLILLDQKKLDRSKQITIVFQPDLPIKYPISESVENKIGLDVLLYYVEHKELPQDYLWKNEAD